MNTANPKYIGYKPHRHTYIQTHTAHSLETQAAATTTATTNLMSSMCPIGCATPGNKYTQSSFVGQCTYCSAWLPTDSLGGAVAQ